MAKKTSYKDLKEIKEIFEKSNNNKSKLALSLIDEAIFLGNTLERLKENIVSDGTVVEMCQGNYSIYRENPALKSYNVSIKNYQALMKQILDILPSEKDNVDDFESFGDE